ncbi:hypothetical protein HPB49_022641 [Dermacentor silvarum]|uniref:Uncharacterized protein n=1 Tax=Dermacentor silvarum TaxID=543639 RepID=A0ACB8CN68_DERSI|nr:hypothetical protein HPB49_022641 [Dermacentor silvarum]
MVPAIYQGSEQVLYVRDLGILATAELRGVSGHLDVTQPDPLGNRGATCTSRRQFLVRRIEQEHAIRIVTKCNKCSHCGAELSLRPSGNACFSDGSLEAPATRARHQCPHCVASFPSARVLASPIMWYEKQDAMVRALSRRAPPAPALPAARSDDQVSPTEEQQASSSRSQTHSVPDPSSGEHPIPPSTDTPLPPIPDTPGSTARDVSGPADSAATDPDPDQIAPDDVDNGPPSPDIPDTTSLLRDQAATQGTPFS